MSGLSDSDRQKILAIKEKFGVLRVRVFGSHAKGTATESSDIDLLVDFPTNATLLTIIGFKQAVEDAIHRNVDVLEEAALSPVLKEGVLKEAIPI